MADDLEKMMNEYLAAWNAHDVEKLLSFFTDDIVYDDVPIGKAYRGKKEVKDFAISTFANFPDFKLEMKPSFIAGDQAAGEWVMSGTFANSNIPGMPATGKSFSIPGASVTEFRGGKISRNADYWNMAAFLQQVGLMPPPPK